MSGGGNPTAAQASSSFLGSAVILPVIVSVMAVVVPAIAVLLAAVVYAISILIVPRLNGMVAVPVPGNVTPIVGSSFLAAFTRLAAVVYAVVVLIVTGFHVMLVVPVARDVTCVSARIPSTIVAAISVGGLFTRAAFVLRWTVGRSVIGRMVGVIARVPGTTACVIRGVVRRLIRWIRADGPVTCIRRPLVWFGTRGNLLMMILDASRPLISSRGVSQHSRDQFFGFCTLWRLSFADRANRGGAELVNDADQQSVGVFIRRG